MSNDAASPVFYVMNSTRERTAVDQALGGYSKTVTDVVYYDYIGDL